MANQDISGSNSVEQHLKYALFSPVIHPNLSGMYHIYQIVVLSRNEVCRRELIRFHRSLESFDVIKKPWKAIALQKWLSEYFLLLVNLFERQKSVFLCDRFLAMGYELPPELSYDEQHLHSCISRLVQLATTISNLCLTSGRFNPHKILSLVESLKYEAANFKMMMENHYTAEENFWPDKIHTEGKDEAFFVLSKMALDIRDMMDHSIGELCTASILYTAGHMHKVANTNDVCDLPWCDARTCTELLKTLPYVVKVVPFMHQISRLMQYRTMILSLQETEDSLDLINQYRQQQMERYLGCGGWLWKTCRRDPNPVKEDFDKNFMSMRITAEMRALSQSASRDEYSPPSISRKMKQNVPGLGYRSASLDSFADMDPSLKSSPSPGNSARAISPPSMKKSNFTFPSPAAKIMPVVNTASQSVATEAAKKAFSPRFFAMVSHSGSTDTTDSFMTRGTHSSPPLGSSSSH